MHRSLRPFPWLFTVALFAAAAAAQEARTPISFRVATSDLERVERWVMPVIDNAALTAAAERRERRQSASPYRFAHPIPIGLDPQNAGSWELLVNGTSLWRLRLASPNAVNLNLAFSRFELPVGASLWLYDPDRRHVEGPFTSRDRSRRGRFYSPIVPGNEVVIEVHLPSADRSGLDLHLERIHHGFRLAERLHGSCNIDVVCPEGDAWRDQIRSVATYTVQGFLLCSGQLINNTARDDAPYFLSAFHCGVDDTNDDTVVVYWNDEAPVCGQRNGGDRRQNQSGAIFRASEETTDFLLLELEEAPSPESDVFFAGWDVSGDVPQGSVGIHHPEGHVKSISFNEQPLGTTMWIDPDTHWEVDNWERGTTEAGSSGSCLFDPASGLCVGVLTAGLASCEVLEFDIYGKLSEAWDIGADPSSRLRDWLDPLGTGLEQLAGKDPAGRVEPPGGRCQPSADTLCLGEGRRFRAIAEWLDRDTVARSAPPVLGSPDSGATSFFDPDIWEVMTKVLDGCEENGHFWLYAAAATNLGFTLEVTDTATGSTRTYTNPPGNFAPVIADDTFAACNPDPAAVTASHTRVHLAADTHPSPAAARMLELLFEQGHRAQLKPATKDLRFLDRKDEETCIEEEIACNSTVTGTLATTDCALDDGTFVDFWRFAGTEGDLVTLDLESDDFDTFLLLLNPDPATVAADDDGGSGTNSRIELVLDSTGDWRAAVNNLLPVDGDPGSYTLSLACSDEATGVCRPSASTSCLNDGRFKVEVDWGPAGGSALPASTVDSAADDSGLFWFLQPDNWEVMVKVLDGCEENGHFWVGVAAATNLGYTVRVTDTETDEEREYTIEAGGADPATIDITAFATCP